MISWYFSGGYCSVPRNIMCSKKWAKPLFPGSTSLREPVWTGICSETRLGKPVFTMIARRPLGSSRSRASKGITLRPEVWLWVNGNSFTWLCPSVYRLAPVDGRSRNSDRGEHGHGEERTNGGGQHEEGP